MVGFASCLRSALAGRLAHEHLANPLYTSSGTTWLCRWEGGCVRDRMAALSDSLGPRRSL